MGYYSACGSVTGELVMRPGHGLTCGSVTGELTGCNGRTWVNLWVCDCGTGTHGVLW